MRFRLIYQGPLPSAGPGGGTRREEKHNIRKVLHPQLRELWQIHPALKPWNVTALSRDYARDGFNWLPLVRKNNGIACALDVLFMRRDMPGGLVKKGGDIDNRMKVFLDALRMPEEPHDVRGLLPTSDENPFYVLLQDDYFITELNVVTDRLLVPVGDGHIHDVHIVLNVRIEVIDSDKADYEFMST